MISNSNTSNLYRYNIISYIFHFVYRKKQKSTASNGKTMLAVKKLKTKLRD